MNSLLVMALSNAVIAGIMAVVVFAISRLVHRPALIHCLWLVVLLKLITPPVVPIPIEVTWWEAPGDHATESKQTPSPSRIARVSPVSSRLDIANGRESDIRVEFLPVQRGFASDAIDPDIASMPERKLRSVPTETKLEVQPDSTVKVEASSPMIAANEVATGKSGLVALPMMEMSQTPERDTAIVAQATVEEPADIAAEPAVATRSSSENRWVWGRSKLLAAFFAVWMGGSIFYAILLLVRVMYFRHVLRQAVRAPEYLQQETAVLAARLGMTRVPEVLLLPGAISPMLWAGGLRPRLLFPRALLGRMDAQGRSTLLLHELAHMHRGDHWVRYIELLASCLYWWNPVLWWARREIHLAEEQCCDALVVEQTGDGGRTYANALLDTIDFLADARIVLPPAASGIGHVDFVKRRLTQIMQGAIAGRLSTPARGIVLVVAVLLLPLLPTFARPPASTETSEETQSVSDKTPDKNVGEVRDLPLPAPQPPDIGSGEPLDFEARSTSLQFEALEMRTMALSPDGTLLATGHGRWTTAGAVRIRNLKTGKDIAVFREQKGVASVKFSPDGKLLATCGWGGTLFIREARTFKVVHEIPVGNVARLAFSPDGKSLAGATEGEKLILWDPVSGKQLPALEGTFFRMQHVAFSPDGRYLAVGGGKFSSPTNGRVAVWDLKTRKQIKVMEDFANPVISVAFSPDSRKLAAGGFDRLVHVWNMPDLKSLFTLRGHGNYIERITFSPDGKRLFSASHDRSVFLWDTFTGGRTTTFAHPEAAFCGAFTSDGKQLYTGGEDKIVRRWDLVTERGIDSFTPGQDTAEFPEPILAVAYSPDGSVIASAHDDKTVRIRDAASGEILRVLKGHEDVVSHIAYSPDGKQIATASYDKTVRLWKTADGTPLRTLTGHTNWVFATAFSPNGKLLASCGYDKTIRLWNPTDGKAVATLNGHAATVRSVAFSPDGRQLVSGAGDRTAKVWDVATRKELRTLTGHQGTLRAVTFSPDGGSIATACEDKTARIWNAGNGEQKQELTHTGMVWCLAYSPGGQILATGGFDNRVTIWNPKTGGRRMQLSGHSDVITSLSFSPDMKGLVSGSYDRTLRLWQTKQPPIEPMVTIAVSPQGVRDVQFSRDGRWMAAAGHDGIAKVWDTATGTIRHVFRGHAGGVRTIGFSPDNRLLATGSWDHTIQLWNLETGKNAGRLEAEGGSQNVTTLKFLPDSKSLVSGGHDGIVRLWDVETTKNTFSFPALKRPVVDVDVSPDGQYLLLCTGDYQKSSEGGQIQLWDLKSRKQVIDAVTKTHCRNAEFHPDGKRFAVSEGNGRDSLGIWDIATRQKVVVPMRFGSASRISFLPAGKTIAVTIGKQILIIDLKEGRELARFTGHDKTIYNIAASPDGTLLASVCEDGTVKLWPLRRQPELSAAMNIAAHKGASRFVLETPGGKRLITGGHDKLVKIWDRKSGKLLHAFKGHTGGVTCGALSPDGSLLATGSWDKTVRFWNVSSLKPVDTVLKNGAELTRLRFSKDGRQLITGGRGNHVQIWEIATGKSLRKTVKQKKPIVNFDISSDGTLLVGVVSDWKTPTEPGEVKLWSFPGLKEIGSLASHRLELKSAKFSNDGRRILVGGSGGLLMVFDATTRKPIRTIDTGEGVMDASFVADGELVASGEWSGKVTVWDPNSRRRLAVGSDHKRFVLNVVASADNSQLFSTGDDGTVRVWTMPSRDVSLIGRARRWTSPRNVPRIGGFSTRLVGETGKTVLFGTTSADFRMYACGDETGTIRLYEASNNRLISTLKGHAGKVLAGQFSPDGLLLATTGVDKSVRLWDAKTGSAKTVLKGHEAAVNSLVFTPDGARVISADAVGEIHIWHVAEKKLEVKFRSIRAGLKVLAISPDGKLLATGGWSKDVDLWRIRDRRLLGTLKGHKSRVTSLAFSPDGRTLISGDASPDDGKHVKIWDVTTRSLRSVAHADTKNVLAIRFSPDGNTFVTTGEDRTLKVWDLATGQLLSSVPAQHARGIHSLDWSADGQRLMTTSFDVTARIWSYRPGNQRWMAGYTTMAAASAKYRRDRDITQHGTAAWFTVFSPDGKQLATGGQDRLVRIWDTATWKLLAEFKGHQGDLTTAAFSPDGKLLATGSADRTIALWSLSDGKRIAELKGHKGPVRKTLFTHDGKRLVSVSGDGTMRLWDVASAKQLQTTERKIPLYSLALSPDGKTIAVGGGDWRKKRNGVVTLLDSETGKLIKEMAATSGLIWSLAYLPDGRLVIANAGGVGLAIWDVKTERKQRVLHWPRDVRSLRVSRDGKTITAGYGSGNNGWVGMWKTDTGESIASIHVGDVFLFDLAVSPVGLHVATATKDGKIGLWKHVIATTKKTE